MSPARRLAPRRHVAAHWIALALALAFPAHASAGVVEFSGGISAAANIRGITAGPDGNMWFTEAGTSKIGRITATGQVDEFALAPGRAPEGITTGPDGNLWFTEASGAIGTMSVAGALLHEYPTAGTGAERITTGPDGNLWFTLLGATSAVGKVTTAGVMTTYTIGLTPGAAPWGVATGPDGNLWFAEYGRGAVGRSTPSGAIAEFTTGITEGAGGQGIVSGPGGRLWFAESSLGRIGRITTGGSADEIDLHPAGFAEPTGLVAHSDGSVYFADFDVPAVGRVAADGAVTTVAALGAGAASTDIAEGPDHSLWVAEGTAGRIARVDAGGPPVVAPPPPPTAEPAPPHAALRVGPATVNVGDDVVFDARESTGQGLRFAWTTDVPGSEHADGGTLSLRYAAAGPHGVTLTVTDARGRTDMLTRQVAVAGRERYVTLVDPTPVANRPIELDVRRLGAGGRLTGLPSGTIVTLDGAGLRAPERLGAIATPGRQLSNSGDFGVRAPAGDRTVAVSVTDRDGATVHQTIELHVAASEAAPERKTLPPACFTYDDPPIVDDPVLFHDCTPQENVHCKDIPLDYVSHETQPFVMPFAEATIDLPAIRNIPNLKNLASIKNLARGARAASQARAAASAKVCNVTDAVTWDFGDGSQAKGRAPSHKYAAAGHYHVRLTVQYYVSDPRYPTGLDLVRAFGPDPARWPADAGILAQGSRTADDTIEVVAPVHGPIDVKGITVRSIDDNLYPAPSQGRMHDGSPKVFVTSKFRGAAGLQGLAIGRLRLLPTQYDAFWINRETGYIGPFPRPGEEARYAARMTLPSGDLELGTLTEPLALNGQTQTFQGAFDGDNVKIGGLPLLGLPKVTLTPRVASDAQAVAQWPVHLPGPLGVKVRADQAGHPETAVPTWISSADLVAGLRRQQFGANVSSNGDFDLALDKFDIGPLSAGPFDVHHRVSGPYSWYGGGQIHLPIALVDGLGIDGTYSEADSTGFALRQADGSVAWVGAKVPITPPINFGGLVDLDSVGFRFGTDPFFLSGEGAFSNAGLPDVVRVDGCISYIYGQGSGRKLGLCRARADGNVLDTTSGVRVRAAGVMNLDVAGFDQRLGSAWIQYTEDSGIDLHADSDFSIELFGITFSEVHASLDVRDLKSFRSFSIWGEARATVLGFETAGGLGITDHGVGACFERSFVKVGFATGRNGGGGFIGCGTVKSKLGIGNLEARSAQAGAAGPPTSVTVPFTADGRRLEFAVSGRDGAPRVTLTGPRGERIVDPGTDGTIGRSGGVLHFADAHMTLIAVRTPTTGDWKIESDQPITKVQTGAMDPKPAVSATLSKAGHRRTLRYRATLAPGERIEFTQSGGRALAPATEKSRGTIAFTPLQLEDTRREIVAVVTRDGIPQLQKTVARFAVAAPRPLRLRGLRARVHGSVARLSWRRTRGARGYLVTSTLRIGGVKLTKLGARARGVVLSGVRSADRGRIAVEPVGRLGQKTHSATVRIKRRPRELPAVRL
jgi:streptogramin lyase